MMEAARTSETSVDIYLAMRQYIPEDSELHTRRRENLKSHKDIPNTKHFTVHHFSSFTIYLVFLILLPFPLFFSFACESAIFGVCTHTFLTFKYTLGSSVSIVSDWRLDGWDSIPGIGKRFFL
jgi:hypothetical protein